MTRKPFKIALYLMAIFFFLSQSVFALNIVELSPGYYPNTSKGRPLALAYIYVGIPDLDPTVVANQKTLSVQQEDGTIVAVTQPIRTNAGGVPTYLGESVVLLVEGDYSLTVLDSGENQIYYVPSTAYDQYLIAGNYFYPEYSEADQGVVAVGAGDTVTDILAAVGAVENATIYFSHDSGGNTTTYTFTTNTTISANYNIIIEKGVEFDGAGTLTINGSFEPVLYQIFGSSITVVFGPGSCKELIPDWWETNAVPGTTDMTVAIQSAFTASYTSNIPVFFSPSIYYTGTIDYYNQSFYGSPGATWYPDTQATSTIKGKDSEDIFRYPDPGSDATVKLTGTVIKDILMIVDDTTDASGSFASRNGPGNAAMAWPIADGADIGTGSFPIHARFSNVHITSKSETAKNASAGLFFQNPPYDCVFDQVHINRLAYGYHEAQPGANVASMEYASDANQYINIYLNGNTNPFQSYNAWRSTINGMQVYSSIADSNLGISLLQFDSLVRDRTEGWLINNLYQESLSTQTTQEYSVIQGFNHTFVQCGLKTDYGEQYVTWSAMDCDFIGGVVSGCTSDLVAILRITGDRNRFSLSSRAATNSFISDTGDGNTVEVTSDDASDTVRTTSKRTILRNAGRVLPSQHRSADFTRIAPSTSFNNQDDLWIWPSDIYWDDPAAQPTITKLATLQTGEYVTLPSGGDGFFTRIWYEQIRVGEAYHVPIGKVRVYIKIKSQASASTQTWGLNVNAVSKGSAVLSLKTTWQVLSWDADATGTTRGHIVTIVGAAVTVAQAVDIAWIAIVPYEEEELGANIGTGWGIYDFDVNSGATGSYRLGQLFDNAIITRAFYQTITDPTSGGAATIAIEVATDDANGIVTATAYDDAVFDPGYHEAIQSGAVTNFTTQTTAIRDVNLTIAGADLTAGKIKVWWEYVVGE